MSIRNEETSIVVNSPPYIDTEEIAVTRPYRLSAMDIQRGLIMILMAFSHCREYVAFDHYTNLRWSTSAFWEGTRFIDFIQQVLVSTVVAGGFFMMMGVGIVFLYQGRLKDGWSLERTCQYLCLRGGLLILLQLTFLQIFEIIAENKVHFYAGVLMSLGFCMIFAALTMYAAYKLRCLYQRIPFEYLIPLALMFSIMLGFSYLINYFHETGATPTIWQTILLLGGKYSNGVDIIINFTPLCWFPATAFGLMIGSGLIKNHQKTFEIIWLLSFLFLVSWFVLRTGHLSGWFTFGEFKLIDPKLPFSFLSYFSMSKYPPSLCYFLWAFGINLACLYYFYKKEMTNPFFIRLINPIKIFGQCALIFFLLHWIVYYSLSLFLNNKTENVVDIFAFWIIGLCILYPICKIYYAFKMKKAKDSIWRMF